MKRPRLVFTGYFWLKGAVLSVTSLFVESAEASNELLFVAALSFVVMALMYLVESSPDSW